ncbi:MAG: KpsF/GutQ family sugar-phosphate isomerase [Bacteroidales bacterium]|nr:KpsF/GutQ family sugar-phosphate isomerase [Bacteroidales bacterium]
MPASKKKLSLCYKTYILDKSIDIKQIAIRTILEESSAIKQLSSLIDHQFEQAVNCIAKSSGRLIITGIGKSANIANKIVSTLNSTGTAAVFMHAADAIHGDLGIIRKNDIVLCISKSGESPEIKVLIPLIKGFGNTLIAISGNTDSFLAKQADYVLNASVEKEACPNNLAPTSSTTAQLVLGDALAVSLLELKGFTTADFAKIHPGGALGKQLYLQAKDIISQNEKPEVDINASIQEVIIEMTSKRLGATAVLNTGKLVGIITDGDLRRMLKNNRQIDRLNAEQIMSKDPKQINPDTLLVDALNLMRSNNITQLPVSKAGKYLGILHLHDILKEGIL